GRPAAGRRGSEARGSARAAAGPAGARAAPVVGWAAPAVAAPPSALPVQTALPRAPRGSRQRAAATTRDRRRPRKPSSPKGRSSSPLWLLDQELTECDKFRVAIATEQRVVRTPHEPGNRAPL